MQPELAFEDRGVVYTVSLDLTEAEVDSLLLRNTVPASVIDLLLSPSYLGTLIGLRISMQQTARENLQRHKDKHSWMAALDPACSVRIGGARVPK